MTIGTIYAITRLKKQKISCISPPRVNVSGKLKVFCFDKTGTLTEDGLDIKGVHPAVNQRFEEFVGNYRALSPMTPLFHSLAACHSLARLIKKNPKPGEPDSEIIGDPLEIKMFDMTQWHFDEPRVGGSSLTLGAGANISGVFSTVVPKPFADIIPSAELPFHPLHASNQILEGDQHATMFALIRQFTFSSALQRMAVIAGATNGRDYQGPLFIFAKVCRVTMMN